MTQRSPAAVFILTFITLGIYGIWWYVKTKGEMNVGGAGIPTAWLIIIPIVNWFWLWKYSQGVEIVTNKASGAAMTFILLFILGPIGMAVTQSAFNKIASGPATPASLKTP